MVEYASIRDQRMRDLFSDPYRVYYLHEGYRPARFGRERIQIRAFDHKFCDPSERWTQEISYHNHDKHPRSIDLSDWFITFGQIRPGEPVWWLQPETRAFGFSDAPNLAYIFDIREIPEPRWAGDIVADRPAGRGGRGFTIRVDPVAAMVSRLGG